MKKTTRTARKVLSVFLSVLMILTTLTVAVPGLVLAADGNKYYVKVYVNIYDGSDGYGGAYSVEESTGKPKNYSWATNDGWYGRINMTGFTVFGENGDYDAQDVSAALLEAEKLNTYYDMSGLSNDNANGDWDSKRIANEVYTFTLDSFPVEIFWMNDENNWDGGNTGFAIRKLTVATSENGTEHTMWEGLAGSDSETYNYYGSITPTGIHTCFEDYAKNYDMNDYKFYKAITSSSQRAWTDPYTYGSAGTYYLNEYANGGVSATFSEGTTSVASTVDYIDTSSTDTYYVNYTNHSKTQIAEITGTYNDGNFVSSPYGIKLNPGETRSFEINKSNYSKLAKYNNAANFTFEYTLSNVYASDELNAPLAKFTQPTYIGLWNEANDSPKYITDEDGDGSTGYTLKMSNNYTWGDNSMTMTNTFQVTEGIIERNSATTGSGSNSVTFNYNYYVDVSNVSTWEDTGLRIYVTEDEYYRMPFQPKEYPSECGTITLSGNYANTGAASITIADIAFTNVTEAFWYSHSQASGYSTYGYYNQKGTPMWATQGKDAQATFYNNNPGWLRFAGTMIEPSDSSADPAKIVMDKMVYRENQNGQKAYFSGTINVYAFDKAELRDYIQKTLLDFAPMSLRYNTTAFENYQNKLASAMNVLADQKTTQKAVTNALAELKSAVAALQSTDNLINQVDELTHIQYVDDIGSEEAARIDTRYVLIPLGEHTVPQNSAYIGNGTYKDATNKKSNLTTNYTKNDTEIDTLNYYYWNIEFADHDENRTVVDYTIESLETVLNNFDSDTYSAEFKQELVNAKATLEAIDQNDGTNTPASQEEVESAIINADNLIAHLGNNMRVHQWIEDDQGNYVAESDEDTHWYTCSICGYELVYNHTFAYEKINDAQHKVTCVTNSETGIEGCGYTYNENHTDNNKDHLCDGCGAKLSDCADGDNDHKCDVCGDTLSECADSNNDHNCEYCNGKVTDCVDADKDHDCDICGTTMGTHADTNNDHNCEYCNGKVTDCVDADKDHDCDICGTTMGTHADTNNDHNCDVCGDKLSDCADGDNDHNCDVCGATLSECVDNDKNHKCDVCGEKLSDCTWGAPVLTTKPTETTDGEYTYTCEVCGGKKYVAVEREDYSAYDEAIKKAEELLKNDDLTQAAKDRIEAAIEEAEKLDQNLPADVVVDGETIIDNDSAEKIADATNTLNNVLNGIVDGDGNISDEYKKPDTSAAEEAVEKAEALEENIELPADVKTQIDELREELNGIIEEIAKDDNATEAEYKDDLNKVEDAANAILEKYAACEKDGHKFGAETIATYPVYDEASDTWSQGTYTKTCEVCGYVKTVAYNRANYEAYDKAVDDLNSLLANENITAEAKAEIKKVLTDNAIRYDLMTPDQSIVDAAVAKFVAEYNKITNDETGAYEKPDYTEAEQAIENAKALGSITDDDKAVLDGLKEDLEEIKNKKNPEATAKDDQDDVNTIRDEANKIIYKYSDCEADNHTDVETDGDHNCDVCGKADVTEHDYANPVLTRPALVDGKWVDGYYTSTCNCGETAVTTIARADYKAYDKAVADLNALLDTGKLTQTAVDMINAALEANDIFDYYVATTEEQKKVDDAAAALKVTLGELTDDNGLKKEYEKVDFTNYNAAVNAAEALKDVMTDADKAAVEAAKKTVTDAGITDETSKADGQKTLDDAAAAIAAINAKYGDCASDNHKWGEPKLTTEPSEGKQGEYTETCTVCGTTQITKVDLADYREFNTVVEALENLANTENLTTEAAKAIADALAMAEELDKNLPADVTTVNGKEIKGGQDEIDALVEELSKVVADTNAAISDGSALLPDYDAWNEAEKRYDALTEEELANVKAEIITEANNLKTEIAAKEADKTLTQATATQKDIDDATARLNEIIAGINNGTLVKPDYNGAEKAIEDAKEVADSENIPDDTEAEIEAEIAELEKQLNEIKESNPSSTDKDVNDKIADIEQAAKDIIDTYGECAKGNHRYADATCTAPKTCEVCGATDGDANGHTWEAEGTFTADNSVAPYTGYYTYDCENCEATTVIRVEAADYSELEKAVDALEKIITDNPNLTDDAKKTIQDAIDKAEALPDDLTKSATEDGVTTPDGQKTIDDLVAELEGVKTDAENGINDKTALKPDYSEWDVAEGAYDALDKTNVKAEIITEAEALKAEIAEKEANKTLTQATATQKDIDDATARLNEIVAGIKDGSLTKIPADFTEVDKDLADAKDKAENNAVVDGVKEDIKEIEDKLNELKNDPTTSADDQPTIDALEKELEDIIAGIEDGSLLPPDYSRVEAKLEEIAKTGNLNKDTQNEVNAVRSELQAIKDKTNPKANKRDDQPAVDALEKRLDDILAKIADGSGVAPDYKDVEKAIKDAEKIEILTDTDREILEGLKEELNKIKNDPTSNKRDDQSVVDAIKETAITISEKYSPCLKGEHTKGAEVKKVPSTCTERGYTIFSCAICGTEFKDEFKAMIPHNPEIIPGRAPTCSAVGLTEGKKCTMCNEIIVPQEEIAKLPHTDADEDGVCDNCHTGGIYDGCSCLCHNTHWFWQIVYMIFRIIWKVFKIHPTCACGRIHY